MLARLALESDRAVLHRLGRAHAAEKVPHLNYDPVRADVTFDRYLSGANPTFWVVEDRREVVGFCTGLLIDNAFTDGFSAILDVIYVRPDKRGIRAAAELINEFNSWADRLGPADIFTTMANGDATRNLSPAMARFLQRFGFKPAGTTFRR